MINLSNSEALEPDTLVYVKVDPENPTEAFNEELWDYMRKGHEKPTLITIKAKDVNIGESVYDMDGNFIADRVS